MYLCVRIYAFPMHSAGFLMIQFIYEPRWEKTGLGGF